MILVILVLAKLFSVRRSWLLIRPIAVESFALGVDAELPSWYFMRFFPNILRIVIDAPVFFLPRL